MRSFVFFAIEAIIDPHPLHNRNIAETNVTRDPGRRVVLAAVPVVKVVLVVVQLIIADTIVEVSQVLTRLTSGYVIKIKIGFVPNEC